jgi:hypothetical protein
VVLIYQRKKAVEQVGLLALLAATQEVTVEVVARAQVQDVAEAATVAHQRQVQCVLWCG